MCVRLRPAVVESGTTRGCRWVASPPRLAINPRRAKRSPAVLTAGHTSPGVLGAQQRALNRFRALYNDERPHDYLDGRTYQSSRLTSLPIFPVEP